MLATTFNKRLASETSSTDHPLTDAEMKAVAPSIFAPGKAASRSERYTYIPTIEVLNGLRREGFEAFYAIQAKSRRPDGSEYMKHMIRLRASDSTRSGEANEVILVNSDNGTSAYQLIAGVFSFVCSNGLVVGDCFDEIRVYHKGNIVDQVISGAYQIVDQFKQVGDHVSEMKALPLSEAEQNVFAEAALELRYQEEHKPITHNQVIQPRRYADAGNSVWHTFNRAQENLVHGGQSATTATERRTRTRPVRNISGNVALNRALWKLAEGMRQLKNGEELNIPVVA
jgi:hypothetical protein